MEFRFASPELWQPLVAGLDGVAKAILTTSHNRHIGITPGLAQDLANLMQRRPAGKNARNIWSQIMARMVRLSQPAGVAGLSASAQRHGVLPSALPAYTVLRVALPVIEQACRELNYSILFTHDAAISNVTGAEFAEYETKLAEAIKTLATDESESRSFFWTERALTIAGGAHRQMTRPGAESDIAPDFDAAAAALFLRMETKLPQSSGAPPSAWRAKSPPPNAPVRRRKEGGLIGIYKTLRQEDLNEMLQSEFLYPRRLLLERLHNEGFLAKQRPPKRDPLRDVLLVFLVPPHCNRLVSAFLKACWFDLCVRLAQRLCGAGLFDTEFRIVEGNSIGQARSIDFQLEDLTDLDLITGDIFRFDFRTALGWLPAYLTSRGSFENLPPQAEDFTSLAGGLAWMQAAWQNQREATPARSRPKAKSNQPAQRLNPAVFAHVHLMATLPTRLRDPENPLNAASALHYLQNTFAPGSKERQVSVTWVPDRLTPSPDWQFDTLRRSGAELFAAASSADGSESPQITEAEFAGGVVGAWLEQLTLEILGKVHA